LEILVARHEVPRAFTKVTKERRIETRRGVREIKSDVAARIRIAIETARSRAGMRNDRGTGKPNNTKFLVSRFSSRRCFDSEIALVKIVITDRTRGISNSLRVIAGITRILPFVVNRRSCERISGNPIICIYARGNV